MRQTCKIHAATPLLLLSLALSAAIGVVSAAPNATSGYTHFKVLANNDLGMHCVDKDFRVFSLLPPYNVVNAQLIGQSSAGHPKILGNNLVKFHYSPVPKGPGWMNSTSKSKTNFWAYAGVLYGASLKTGEGLKGLYMPADAPDRPGPGKFNPLSPYAQFRWNQGLQMFAAEGIPILPIDDDGTRDRYPLMRVTAYDKTSNKRLASVDVVVPVSEETTCDNCHATGKVAATGSGWSKAANLDVQSRTNVLILHDRKEGTHLRNRQPVLCASCHYSPALDLSGTGPTGSQVGMPTLSAVMHDFHAPFKKAGEKTLYDAPAPVAGLNPELKGVPPSDQQTCYQCHPGKNTKCLRGAMTDAVTCQNCHGGMKAVGGSIAMKSYGTTDRRTSNLRRSPWRDEPRCQSCHTGDALNHIVPATAGIANTLASDGIRLMLAYNRNDPAAAPLLAGAAMGGNKRFAENDGKLFRHSKGHRGVACEGCHGSTHAIWPGNPSVNPKDNRTANQLQGHAGTIIECATCHRAGTLPLTLNGPHGLHNVNDPRWTKDHHELYKRNKGACQACHGRDLRGTVLSRTAAVRTYSLDDGKTKSVPRGTVIGCYTCHNGPNDDD